MKINVIYDASVSSAPAGFQTGVATAVDFLEEEFANPVTITIHVGYGEVDGQALGANALGKLLCGRRAGELQQRTKRVDSGRRARRAHAAVDFAFFRHSVPDPV